VPGTIIDNYAQIFSSSFKIPWDVDKIFFLGGGERHVRPRRNLSNADKDILPSFDIGEICEPSCVLYQLLEDSGNAFS
jgi:hypothetical protein